jgi:hypothetical protein
MMNVIAAGDAAINAENFDAIMTFYADDATLVVEPGRCVTGHAAIRAAFKPSPSTSSIPSASRKKRSSSWRAPARLSCWRKRAFARP